MRPTAAPFPLPSNSLRRGGLPASGRPLPALVPPAPTRRGSSSSSRSSWARWGSSCSFFELVGPDGPAVLGLGLIDDALEVVEHGRLRCAGAGCSGTRVGLGRCCKGWLVAGR